MFRWCLGLVALTLLLISFREAAHAADAGSVTSASRLREAALEWEPIGGAVRYEIEVLSLIPASTQKIYFKTKGPSWNGRLKPGKYSLRLRAYDLRQVPGTWSEPSEFWVRVEAPTKKLPDADLKILSKDEDLLSQTFAWHAVNGALKYKLSVNDVTLAKPFRIEITDATEFTMPLPVAHEYSWSVIAIMSEDQPGEDDLAPRKITITGPKLATPEIVDPLTDFVRELKWSSSPRAEHYPYEIEIKMRGGKWRSVAKDPEFTATTRAIPLTYPGGTYRIKLRAVAKLRIDSESATLEFNLRKGDRSPEAANLAMLRESYEKPTNFYFITSYFISNVHYQNIRRDLATAIDFDALGGTGRIGFGYRFKKTPWSTFTVLDLSGFNVGGQTKTFSSAEVHVVWAQNWNVSLLRASGGLFFKELPEASGRGFTPDDVQFSLAKISSVGPHAGFEFLHPLTYRLGVQTNARIYMSALGLSTPNGQKLVTSYSYQFSLLGSYRFDRKLVGFAGYSYRRDNALYQAPTGDSSTPGSGAANPGDINSISLTGHYLNLILEYAF